MIDIILLSFYKSINYSKKLLYSNVSCYIRSDTMNKSNFDNCNNHCKNTFNASNCCNNCYKYIIIPDSTGPGGISAFADFFCSNATR